MQTAKRKQDGAEMHIFTDMAPVREQDDPEFSSEPMPAAFSACLFLGLGLVICVVVAFLA